MLKPAHDRLSRVNEAIAEFERMPLTKRIRYTALLGALHDQRRELLSREEPEKVPSRVGMASR
jgi:hypothetical protein